MGKSYDRVFPLSTRNANKQTHRGKCLQPGKLMVLVDSYAWKPNKRRRCPRGSAGGLALFQRISRSLTSFGGVTAVTSNLIGTRDAVRERSILNPRGWVES